MWAPDTYSFRVHYVLMKIMLTDVLNVSLDVDSCIQNRLWLSVQDNMNIFFSPSPPRAAMRDWGTIWHEKSRGKHTFWIPSSLYTAVIKCSAAQPPKKKKKNERKEKEATDWKQMAKYEERHLNEGEKNV